MEKEPSRTLVELKHVQQVYGSGARRFTALRDINLIIQDGEFVALLGPSGCGKSTLLRIITGLQPPSEGEVLYRGEPVRGVNPKATIVFQNFALFPWLTVYENVDLALKVRNVPEKTRAATSLDLIDRVGLDGFETAYPRELSGGMRQKVGFARAMAVEPELLCLDEPFSALDPLSAESLRGELMELWTTGAIPTRAILMVSHNIEEAVFMASRVVVMDKDPGHVAAMLPISLPHPRDRKSSPFQALVDQIFSILAGQTRPEAEELGTAPGEPGITRGLPPVHINDLTGLTEHLNELPESRADVYRLPEVLSVHADYLLQLTEAAELLGLARIEKGDITLTDLGETFAEARILARKDIFATRVRRLPIFRWLLALLNASEKQRIRWEVVKTALSLEFPPDETESQLDTMIEWGRYAEVLAYDDDQEVIYLEVPEAHG